MTTCVIASLIGFLACIGLGAPTWLAGIVAAIFFVAGIPVALVFGTVDLVVDRMEAGKDRRHEEDMQLQRELAEQAELDELAREESDGGGTYVDARTVVNDNRSVHYNGHFTGFMPKER